MSPKKKWVKSPAIPFDKLDGKKVFCARTGRGGQYFGTAVMHVQRHMDHPERAIVRVESNSNSMPGWAMFFDQRDIYLLQLDETTITGAFTCRGED